MSNITTSGTSSKSSFAKLLPAVAALALMAGAFAIQAAEPTATEKVENAGKKVEKAASDSWITTKVKSEILANSASKALKVEVTTKGGVVSLTGKLANQDAIDLVKMIAEKVKGVHSVDTSGLTIG